MSKSSEAESIH